MPSDADLMDGLKQGDRASFALVVDRYKDSMVNYLYRLTGSRSHAEDLAQETFLRLYQTRERYSEMGKLGGYLYRMATNLARSEQRRELRRRVLSLLHLPVGNGSAVPQTPRETLLQDERAQMLKDALGELPLRLRVPLVLYEIEGLSYGEIAGVTGCEQGTVKSRISRGKERLRRCLAPYVQEVAHEG